MLVVVSLGTFECPLDLAHVISLGLSNVTFECSFLALYELFFRLCTFTWAPKCFLFGKIHSILLSIVSLGLLFHSGFVIELRMHDKCALFGKCVTGAVNGMSCNLPKYKTLGQMLAMLYQTTWQVHFLGIFVSYEVSLLFFF